MADSVVERDSEAIDDSLAELRSIIVGPERQDLQELQSHLLDPSVLTRDVSRVLPDAIALRAKDPQLTRALAPTIQEAVTASVRRDPRPLADALFPVMGPAIRKAITHTLASMMESLTRTLEYSVSWRALRWRWTALRTGKSFAEIVLLNTLQYRVEQVFLIHSETGLLLQHATLDAATAQDADQISAMLTAIRDFAHDAFRTADGDSVDTLRVGDLSVFVEQGPTAILAGVVRGTPPVTLREPFQEALESIHRQLGAELQDYQGDPAPFARARPILETCLVSQFREKRVEVAWRRWAVAAAIVLAALAVWAFFTIRERQRFNDYVERLRNEPGIVVLTTGRRDGKFSIAGFRDPLSTDPAVLLNGSRLSSDSVETRWEPFDSVHPPFVTERARRLLRPPPGVTLAYRDGTLTAHGPAPARWVVESERLSPAMTGVRRFAYDGMDPAQQVRQQIEGISILFLKGQSRPVPGQDDVVRTLRTRLAELDEIMRSRASRASVEVVGHTDSDGTDRENGPLSQARADRMLQVVRESPFGNIDLSALGVGTSAPLAQGTSESDKQRNRRASFRVSLPSSTEAGDRR